MRFRIDAIVLALLASFGLILPAATANAAAVPNPSWDTAGAWTNIFQDGFAGTTLKASDWNPGWFGTGNTGPVNSLEAAGYGSSHVSVSGGYLHLSLTKTPITTSKGTFPNTGALVDSNGKFSFTYGAVEFRAYLPPRPNGQIANWPATWADGMGVWPTTGEMDVMEGLLGPACYHFHDPLGGPGACAPATQNYSGWHTFGAQWQPGSVTYYYDGKNVGSITTGITGDPMYLVMDYTVNANDPTPVIPSTMLVDWVRVWKQA